jgi:endonuclease YncB( thermonuclease family)
MPARQEEATVRTSIALAGSGLLGFLLVGSLSLRAEEPPAAPRPEPAAPDFRALPQAHVLSVESNGVIRLGTIDHQRRVRLLGVETPGRNAMRFVQRLIEGKSVYVVPAPAKYAAGAGDSPAVYLYRAPDGLFVNLELVAQGQARTAPGQEFQHRAIFLDREHDALRKGLGLWAPDVRGPDDVKVAAAAAAPAPPKRRPRRAAITANSQRAAAAQRSFEQGMSQLLGRVNPGFGQPPAGRGTMPGMMILPQPGFFFGQPGVGGMLVPAPGPAGLGFPAPPLPVVPALPKVP